MNSMNSRRSAMRSIPAQTLHLGVALAAWAAALGGFNDRSPVQMRVGPAPPQSVRVVVTSAVRVVTFPVERRQLRGDGTPESPYYWVWVPAGKRPPSPPLRRARHQSVRSA
jgi:hypothetical protein